MQQLKPENIKNYLCVVHCTYEKVYKCYKQTIAGFKFFRKVEASVIYLLSIYLFVISFIYDLKPYTIQNCNERYIYDAKVT